MARTTPRAATRHASSSGAPIVFNEGERKPAAVSVVTPRFASTRAQRVSTPTSCESSETTSASGSRSRHLVKPFLPMTSQRTVCSPCLQLYYTETSARSYTYVDADARRISQGQPEKQRRVLQVRACRLPSAYACEEGFGLLACPPPYLGGLSGSRLLFAALEVQNGGPAHRQSASVADSCGGRPARYRYELHDLAGECPKTKPGRQHPEQLSRSV